MLLTNEQLYQLIEILKPNFQTSDERRRILADMEDSQVMPGEIRSTIERSVDGMSAEAFTSSLVNWLADNGQDENGHAQDLLKFLEMAQNNQVNGKAWVLSSNLQPFIDTLRTPEPEPANAIPAIAVAAATTPSGSSRSPAASPAGSVGTSGKSLHRSKRKRTRLSRVVKKVRKAIPWRLLAALLLLAITLPTAGIVVFATDAVAQVNESLISLQRVTDGLSGRSFANLTLDDLDRLQAGIQNLTNSLNRARQQTRLLRHFSFLSPDLNAEIMAMDAAEYTSQAGHTIFNGLQPVVYYLVNGDTTNTVSVQITSGERIIELLQLGQGEFVNAQKELQAAQKSIDLLNLSGLSPKLLLQIQQLIQYQNSLSKINAVLLESPDLLGNAFGVTQPRDYLVLSQNSDELRPSGGYISTYGWMHVRRFRISDYGYSATTDVSPNPPPEALASQLPIPEWWLHFPRPIYSAFDESWYADFPSTAEMAAWYYEKGNNPRSPVQGVIAMDITGFERVLEGLGSVTVPNYNEVVTAANFREVIYRIRGANETDLAHKQFLSALYNQILQDWQTISKARSSQILGATLQALQEKHIMIYFRDPKLAAVMNLLGWSGAQTPGNYDYLMVADANLGNKSNHSIARDITYDVAIQPDRTLQSRATIGYDYSDSVASQDPAVKPAEYGSQKDYGNLMQVFVPKGSAITKTDNLPNDVKTDTWQNLGIFITNVTVKYDTSERYEFSYTTPALIEPFGSFQRYRLLLQKQPGTAGDTVHVQVTLPIGAKVISASPEVATFFMLDNPILEFHMNLVTDQWIEIVYR